MTRPKSPDLVFEDPPEKVRYDWEAIADSLRERPGEWAKVFDNDRASLATAIRLNGIKALPYSRTFEPGTFQVRTRNNTQETDTTPRLCSLYLHYTAEKKKGRAKS